MSDIIKEIATHCTPSETQKSLLKPVTLCLNHTWWGYIFLWAFYPWLLLQIGKTTSMWNFSELNAWLPFCSTGNTGGEVICWFEGSGQVLTSRWWLQFLVWQKFLPDGVWGWKMWSECRALLGWCSYHWTHAGVCVHIRVSSATNVCYKTECVLRWQISVWFPAGDLIPAP